MSQRVGPQRGVAHPSNDAASPSSPRPVSRCVYRPWEEVYPSLPADTQAELRTLAQQQGFLLADQIPVQEGDPVRSKLLDILNHTLAPLPLFAPPTSTNPQLDATQHDALQRLWQTPELALVIGSPGTGKRRLAHELIRLALANGERVLLLATDPTSLDAHLGTLAELPGSHVTRFVGAHENAAHLPADVSKFTPTEQEHTIAQQLTAKATLERTTAEAAHSDATQLVQQWHDALSALQEQAATDAEQAAHASKRANLLADIEKEAATPPEPLPYFVQRLRGAASTHEKKLVPLAAEATALAVERATATTALATLEHDANDLRKKAESLTSGSVFSASYWSARMDKGLSARLAEAETKLKAAQDRLADIALREAKLATTRQQHDDDFQTERTKLLNDEQQRRSAALQATEAELQERTQQATQRVERLWAALGHSDRSPEACATGLAAAEVALATAIQRLEASREWDTLLPTIIASQVAHAKAHVNIVAGPVEIFGDPNLTCTVFDWLIIDGAHTVSEATFVAAARKARRWVLFGDTPADQHTPERQSGRHTRGEFFNRLHAALQTPVWEYDRERLVCRLYPVPPSERQQLECEPVADSPDIELRVYSPADGEPQLAEVAFPANQAIAEAREYLFHELQEVTAQPSSRTAHWHEDDSTIVVRFTTPKQPTFATLDEGVREELDGLHTAAVHFATTSWTREQAEAWANEHLTKRDSGRCIVLHQPYRACPGLAHWLNMALGTTYHVPTSHDTIPHVEFLAVPERERRGRDSARSHRVGGAGYEIDLSDSKQRASLPSDLVADLPTSGWVNLHEAQAILRHLEGQTGNMAVASPFPAQVALMRAMAKQAPRFRHIKFFTADHAEHVECEQLVVSLTRSHVARAVTFGESPNVLAKLLARVRRHVVFVGDPGTLSRRLQWEGPVDHLNAVDAAREHRWIAALADCPRVNTQRHRPHAESVRV